MTGLNLPIPRKAIAAYIEHAISGEIEAPPSAVDALIELLDEIDGDADFEPCPAGDDGLHRLEIGLRSGWGALCDSDSGIVPIYGVDQTQPPLNFTGSFRSIWGV